MVEFCHWAGLINLDCWRMICSLLRKAKRGQPSTVSRSHNEYNRDSRPCTRTQSLFGFVNRHKLRLLHVYNLEPCVGFPNTDEAWFVHKDRLYLQLYIEMIISGVYLKEIINGNHVHVVPTSWTMLVFGFVTKHRNRQVQSNSFRYIALSQAVVIKVDICWPSW